MMEKFDCAHFSRFASRFPDAAVSAATDLLKKSPTANSHITFSVLRCLIDTLDKGIDQQAVHALTLDAVAAYLKTTSISLPAGDSAPRASGTRRRRGGRVPLEKAKPLQFQVYDRIRREHRPNEEHRDTLDRLKHDKDFIQQAQEAKLKLNTELIRLALAFFHQREARNNQQTESA